MAKPEQFLEDGTEEETGITVPQHILPVQAVGHLIFVLEEQGPVTVCLLPVLAAAPDSTVAVTISIVEAMVVAPLEQTVIIVADLMPPTVGAAVLKLLAVETLPTILPAQEAF